MIVAHESYIAETNFFRHSNFMQLGSCLCSCLGNHNVTIYSNCYDATKTECKLNWIL